MSRTEEIEEIVVNDYTYRLLLSAMAEEYAGRIADKIYDEVAQDLHECADENWNDDDIRLAIGRVLCKKLEIEW